MFGKCRETQISSFSTSNRLLNNKMAQQRLSLWNAEEDIEGDVDLSIAMGNYDPTVQYEECK